MIGYPSTDDLVVYVHLHPQKRELFHRNAPDYDWAEGMRRVTEGTLLLGGAISLPQVFDCVLASLSPWPEECHPQVLCYSCRRSASSVVWDGPRSGTPIQSYGEGVAQCNTVHWAPCHGAAWIVP